MGIDTLAVAVVAAAGRPRGYRCMHTAAAPVAGVVAEVAVVVVEGTSEETAIVIVVVVEAGAGAATCPAVDTQQWGTCVEVDNRSFGNRVEV